MQSLQARSWQCPGGGEKQQLRAPTAFRCGVLPRRRHARQLHAAAAKDESGEGLAGKYPDRTPFTGGWAGGEKGLQKFIDEFEEQPTDEKKEKVKRAAKQDPNVVKVSFQGRKVEARKQGEGKDAIYIGKRKGGTGDEETYIVDDDKKYPSKEGMGPLSGVVGGFAGGERGVQQFIEKGEVSLAEPDSRKEASPLVFAIIVAAVGTVGGILLTDVTDIGQTALTQAESGTLGPDVQKVLSGVGGLSDRNKLILEVVLGAAGLLSVVTLGRSAVRSITTNVKVGAVKFATLAAFFAVFGVAFKLVLEN